MKDWRRLCRFFTGDMWTVSQIRALAFTCWDETVAPWFNSSLVSPAGVCAQSEGRCRGARSPGLLRYQGKLVAVSELSERECADIAEGVDHSKYTKERVFWEVFNLEAHYTDQSFLESYCNKFAETKGDFYVVPPR